MPAYYPPFSSIELDGPNQRNAFCPTVKWYSLRAYGINHLVRLVHLLHAAHEDLQVDAYEREQRGLEVNLGQRGC